MNNPEKNTKNSVRKHPKCKGFKTEDTGWGVDYDCGYETAISCDDCKFGLGKKDPSAKSSKK